MPQNISQNDEKKLLLLRLRGREREREKEREKVRKKERDIRGERESVDQKILKVQDD
jgi:hypothetical protein